MFSLLKWLYWKLFVKTKRNKKIAISQSWKIELNLFPLLSLEAGIIKLLAEINRICFCGIYRHNLEKVCERGRGNLGVEFAFDSVIEDTLSNFTDGTEEFSTIILGNYFAIVEQMIQRLHLGRGDPKRKKKIRQGRQARPHT
jgi:hypothetical protein